MSHDNVGVSETVLAALAGAALVITAALGHGAQGAELGLPQLTLDPGGHTDVITDLQFTPSGSLLSASGDKTIREWDLVTGQTARIIRGPIGPGERGRVLEAEVSADGNMLIVGGTFDDQETGEHPVRLYDLASGTMIGLLSPPHPVSVTAINASPNGRQLLTGDRNGNVWLWRKTANSYQRVAALGEYDTPVVDAVFDPSGSPVAVSAGRSGGLTIWSTDGNRLTPIQRTQPFPTNEAAELRALSWSPQGEGFALVSSKPSIYGNEPLSQVGLFGRSGQPVIEHLALNDAAATVVEVAPDSRSIAVGFGFPASDYSVRLYTVANGGWQETLRYAAFDQTVTNIRYSPDNQRLAMAAADGSIHMLDLATGKAKLRMGPRSDIVWNVGFSPDSQQFYWGSQQSDPTAIRRLDTFNDRGPLEWTLAFAERNGDTAIDLVAVDAPPAVRGSHRSPDGQTLTLFQDHGFQLLGLAGGPNFGSRRSNDIVFGTAFLPSAGKQRGYYPTLVASTQALMLFDAAAGHSIREYIGHNRYVLAVAVSPDGRLAISGGSDHTARLWNVETGDLLLSIFQAGTDWVAWTPEGYYAASPDGDQLIGWQLQSGLDRQPEHYAGSHFRGSLYRPDVIARVLTILNVPAAVREADRVRNRESVYIPNITEVLPPRVAIVDPADQSLRLRTSALRLQAKAQPGSATSDANAVQTLRLLLNGRPYKGRQAEFNYNPATQLAEASWDIELDPGDHLLAVQAKSAVSESISDVVRVKYVPPLIPADANTTAPPVATDADGVGRPNLYVLAVGVSLYETQSLRLFFAGNDAKTFASTCETSCIGTFGEVHTKVLMDKQATRAAIVDGLVWLRRQCRQSDVAVLFYSGHGALDETGRMYLLPVNTDVDNLATTAVPKEEVVAHLRGMSNRVLVFLDACHAGAPTGTASAGPKPNSTPPAQSASAITDELIRDLVNDDQGVVVMASAMGRELSLENRRLGMGNFTYALVEGISGKADLTGDGLVYLTELDHYLSERVKDLSGGRHHAVTEKPTTIRNFPVAGKSVSQ